MEISNAELDVMQVIWGAHPATSAEVVARLDNKQWHEKTVKTFLSRLVKKGALTYEKNGRTYLYSPAISEHDYQLKESRSIISRLFKGRVSPLVAGFAKQSDLTKEDIDDLKQIIQDWENKHD
ncbi:BlaI/MecI/CopY family transcriptional regulator [Alteromonas ponticola]|uniref:BlaI/MecI/CopY family transcriptional regulator n=1 Tax=Alteromonas aquimaris TaxID=2998417 RepID=A0ABT3PAH6_9ALTE|nr:BlaI/MecI/CopY family transcriptional regulator [Alteromonas aquimaris]MCW8109782.1 BlaI/MecI/CopY family transcriptional regulator [Alteromonas aquimaris]